MCGFKKGRRSLHFRTLLAIIVFRATGVLSSTSLYQIGIQVSNRCPVLSNGSVDTLLNPIAAPHRYQFCNTKIIFCLLPKK